MDRKQAQLVLSALRPDGSESNEPMFAEALAMLETDPELRAWWQAQQAFDRQLAVKLSQVPVPPGLRDRILAAPKIVEFPSPWRQRSLLAAAAMVAFLCVATAFWNLGPNRGTLITQTQLNDQVVAALGPNGPNLAKVSPVRDDLTAWLRQQNAPVGQIPAKIAPRPSLGCQKYFVGGHVVSLICFSLANGHAAHLFMVDKSAMTNPPDSSGPRYGSRDGWNMAAWSDNNMSYVLATDDNMDDLKQLFSSS